jgi:hypothetical protein
MREMRDMRYQPAVLKSWFCVVAAPWMTVGEGLSIHSTHLLPMLEKEGE